MKVAIVSASALGSRCWLPKRMTGTCASCQRYDACTYPERVADASYDALRKRARELREESDAIYERLKEMTEK